MPVLKFAELSPASLRRIVNLTERRIAPYEWTQVDLMTLDSDDQRRVQDMVNRLLYADTNVMNEATIWDRAIYPLLLLAEQGDIQAWSQVPLRATYPHIELQGVTDGVLGSGITSLVESSYYLVVVEAKRGLESPDPRPQLCGQILAAARLNWERDQHPVQELYGCYTIRDGWNFVRAEVHRIDSDAPAMTIEFSREYVQKLEAETILKILKRIVAKSGEK
ncbi:MAG: hypothetical protein HC884_06150 [Chloroflexaceae bacterium]|nr:hypothetical protein [Chloroflexaceae bacterium]